METDITNKYIQTLKKFINKEVKEVANKIINHFEDWIEDKRRTTNLSLYDIWDFFYTDIELDLILDEKRQEDKPYSLFYILKSGEEIELKFGCSDNGFACWDCHFNQFQSEGLRAILFDQLNLNEA